MTATGLEPTTTLFVNEQTVKITTDHDHDKYVITQEFNMLTTEKK